MDAVVQVLHHKADMRQSPAAALHGAQMKTPSSHCKVTRSSWWCFQVCSDDWYQCHRTPAKVLSMRLPQALFPKGSAHSGDHVGCLLSFPDYLACAWILSCCLASRSSGNVPNSACDQPMDRPSGTFFSSQPCCFWDWLALSSADES